MNAINAAGHGGDCWHDSPSWTRSYRDYMVMCIVRSMYYSRFEPVLLMNVHILSISIIADIFPTWIKHDGMDVVMFDELPGRRDKQNKPWVFWIARGRNIHPICPKSIISDDISMKFEHSDQKNVSDIHIRVRYIRGLLYSDFRYRIVTTGRPFWFSHCQ